MQLFHKIYNSLALNHLTLNQDEPTTRSIRMTSLVQVVMFVIPLMLLVSVITVEPPETHFYSFVMLGILLVGLTIGRTLLYLKHFATAAAITILNIVIHMCGLCAAYADDPAVLAFLISMVLPFLMLTPNHKWLRWSLVLLSAAVFILFQYRYRIQGASGVFGPPKWIVSADYYLPPLIMLVGFMIVVVYQFVKAVDKAEKKLSLEYAKSERLILNILPSEVATELKLKGVSKPRLFESATVCFTDFQGFTGIAETMSPSELVEELNFYFSQFDRIMERHQLEKLKTIGDSYMFAGGIPIPNKTHAIDCVLAALEIQSFMNNNKAENIKLGKPYWELRLGIHTGNLVAGVIGEKKFTYDVWSDTVNTASRCESSGNVGQVNISGTTFELVKAFFECTYRGPVAAKNKGEIGMYFVHGLIPEMQQDGSIFKPNSAFMDKYQTLNTNNS